MLWPVCMHQGLDEFIGLPKASEGCKNKDFQSVSVPYSECLRRPGAQTPTVRKCCPGRPSRLCVGKV
jgi:hypothetical protein